MNDFLSIQGLCSGYGPSFMLKDIDLSIKKSTFAGIIGPNGSGKTTLVKSISGEIAVQSGRILLEGKNLQHLTTGQKARRVAVVTQFFDAMDITVEDYVLTGRIPYRKPFQFFETSEDYQVAHHYMELARVEHLRDKPMSRLSGGEQQLVDIARALTQEPELLLLDEPTSHLDITHQVQVLNLLQGLSTDKGLTILMIIHDLSLAGEYCDYLTLLQDGKIHCQGTPDEVLTYRNIEDVYKTVVITRPNPVSGKPAVFLVSENAYKNIRS
jgi:iron complex transport system ATP-binding protein